MVFVEGFVYCGFFLVFCMCCSSVMVILGIILYICSGESYLVGVCVVWVCICVMFVVLFMLLFLFC